MSYTVSTVSPLLVRRRTKKTQTKQWQSSLHRAAFADKRSNAHIFNNVSPFYDISDIFIEAAILHQTQRRPGTTCFTCAVLFFLPVSSVCGDGQNTVEKKSTGTGT